MRRYRRAKNPIWLPVLGDTVVESGGPDTYAIGRSISFNVPSDGSIGFDAQPVTFDYTDSASTEMGTFDRSLQDLTSGNAWKLRRIVGKCFIGCGAAALASYVDGVWFDVAAGFIVCKTDEVGSATTNFTEVNPLHQDSADDPWIWRRRWLLNPYVTTLIQEPLLAQVASGTFYSFPRTNVEYGSVADGPHIDQKTSRLISHNERLHFVCAARGYLPNSLPAAFTGGQINGLLDIRLLGNLRTQSGNRRNASR